jgi:signal transduction histidine kinase
MKKIESILLVEDEDMIRDELYEVLEDYCNTVYVARNGQEGLEIFKDFEPTIVVSDIRMPIMTGIEMAQEIRKFSEFSNFIFVTAFNETSFLKDAIDIQVKGYILKPIDLDALDGKLNSIIDEIYKDEQSNIKLEQKKIEYISEIMSSIAHQWRQPLNNISLEKEILIEEYQSNELTNEKVERFSSRLDNYLRQLSGIIDEFRLFYEPNESKVHFDIIEMLEEFIIFSRKELDENNIKISLKNNYHETLDFYGFRSEIKQVLLILIKNSQESIIKNKENISQGEITINIDKDETHLYIEVIDNGVGVNKEIIDRIFQPYFTTKFEADGIGLSLYVAKMLIERHMKGSLTVSNISSGAIFQISFEI